MSIRTANLAAALAGMIALGSVGTASATLIFEVLRVSDSVAQIQSTGTLDFGPLSAIALGGATSVGDTGTDGHAGSFTIGGVGVANVFTRNATTNFIINMLTAVSPGDTPAGLLTATLDVESWAVVGTTGSVFEESSPSTVIGRYRIVDAFSAVPEPASLALLGLALVGFGGFRRRAAR